MTNSKGYTLVETAIALVVASVLIGIILSFMTNSIVQYSVVNARSDLLNEAQSAFDIIGRDIRLSGNADQNNRWPDDNAPDSPDDFSWSSDQDTLILARAAEDTDGNIIFADPALYITEKDNNIFFTENGTLYKRTLASTATNNAETTTCPANLATTDCPADRKLLNNVTSFEVKYFNEQNQEVTPTEARSIEISVSLAKNQYNQPVTADYKARMVFRND